MQDTILVTGGAGFIGSSFISGWIAQETPKVLNLDKLTYAGSLGNLQDVRNSQQYEFVQGDICDRGLVARLLREHEPAAIVHFAAESHVDRSILGPEEFIRTNVQGTFSLLEEARHYWERLPAGARGNFRFLHVSTVEVYGSSQRTGPDSGVTTYYAPSSPYSASKAASDHLVRSYFHTYGLPVLTTNSSNNYGPRQFPEKLIPSVILNAAAGRSIPVYGNGQTVRDWVYVADHCRAIRAVLWGGSLGENYNIGGWCERRNIDTVRAVCAILDEMCPGSRFFPHERLIAFVPDRPGYDQRIRIDPARLESELGWRPVETFESGLRKTVAWYLENRAWVEERNKTLARR